MTQRPRVLLLIPHLGGGGAEQVTALLAANLSSRKYDLHLALIIQSNLTDTALPPSLVVHCLGAERVRAGVLPLLRLVRKLRPDLILSGMAHLNLLVLMLRPFFPSGTSVLIRHNGAGFTSAPGDLSPRSRVLYRTFLRRADRIICQSTAMADDLHSVLRIPRDKFIVLHNPVDLDAIRADASQAQCLWNGPGPHLLAVGRLAPEKGFDLLLEAFSLLRKQFHNATLAIAGEGHAEAALRERCNALGLDAAVQFPGRVALPVKYFPGASLFVLSSRHDAMPNALLEAAAGGLPIAALPASPGLVSLLRGQPGVWLARDSSAEALYEALLDALEALIPGQRFPHAWIEPFRLSRVIEDYEALIDAALRGALP